MSSVVTPGGSPTAFWTFDKAFTSPVTDPAAIAGLLVDGSAPVAIDDGGGVGQDFLTLDYPGDVDPGAAWAVNAASVAASWLPDTLGNQTGTTE